MSQNKLYDEVAENMKWLSSFGGTEEGGTTRLLYTDEWLAAQNALKERMASYGMETYFDAIGNLYGRFEGTKYPNEVIASGSHVDTVVDGGKLDGQYGIWAAYLAMKHLVEQYGPPLRTMEAISLAEEEGSRFPFVYWGSKNIFKLEKAEDMMNVEDAKGVRFVDAMHKCGFDFADPNRPLRKDFKAFLELHIEQGCVLETEGQQVGVVTSIVGQRRYGVTLKGEANHAGTTPMGYRKDAIVAFSRMCYEMTQKAVKEGDPLVLTFGRVEPRPNVVNVVPGEVVFTIDCRHTDKAALVNFTTEMEADLERIAKEMKVSIKIDRWMDESPVPMDPKLVTMLEKICKDNEFNYRVMHSGAGHDSQIFAPRVPTAMLFSPSIKGISHNPAEDTNVEDLTECVRALALAFYELAYKE